MGPCRSPVTEEIYAKIHSQGAYSAALRLPLNTFYAKCDERNAMMEIYLALHIIKRAPCKLTVRVPGRKETFSGQALNR